MFDKVFNCAIYAFIAAMVTIIIEKTLFGSKRTRSRNEDILPLIIAMIINSNTYTDFRAALSKMRELVNEKQVDPNGNFKGYIK